MPPRQPADAGLRPRSLGEACRESGLDEDGERCPTCVLRELCESETRWLVGRGERPRYLN
jgi:hypothetical protein